jgi:hypothetical protein
MRSAVEHNAELGRFGSCPVVMICQDCDHAWEPADSEGLRVLLDNGCPSCSGWAWAGELAPSPTASTSISDTRRADA